LTSSDESSLSITDKGGGPCLSHFKELLCFSVQTVPEFCFSGLEGKKQRLISSH